MATATLKRRSRNEIQRDNALDDNIAARAMALREGRPMPELDKRFACEHHGGDVGREFKSAIDARPMAKADRANVEPIRNQNELDRVLAIASQPRKQPKIIRTPSTFRYEVFESEVWDWP